MLCIVQNHTVTKDLQTLSWLLPLWRQPDVFRPAFFCCVFPEIANILSPSFLLSYLDRKYFSFKPTNSPSPDVKVEIKKLSPVSPLLLLGWATAHDSSCSASFPDGPSKDTSFRGFILTLIRVHKSSLICLHYFGLLTVWKQTEMSHKSSQHNVFQPCFHGGPHQFYPCTHCFFLKFVTMVSHAFS